MVAAPAGCVLVGLGELGQGAREVALAHQCLAPQFQGVGETRALGVGMGQFAGGPFDIAPGQQHLAPIGVGERGRWREPSRLGEPPLRSRPVAPQGRELSTLPQARVAIRWGGCDERLSGGQIPRRRLGLGDHRGHLAWNQLLQAGPFGDLLGQLGPLGQHGRPVFGSRVDLHCRAGIVVRGLAWADSADVARIQRGSLGRDVMVGDIRLHEQRRDAAQQALFAEGDDARPPPGRGGVVASLLIDEGFDPGSCVHDHIRTDASVIGTVEQFRGDAVVRQGRLRTAHLRLDIPCVLPRQKHPGRSLSRQSKRRERGLGSVQVAVGVGQAQIAPGALALRTRRGELREDPLGLVHTVLTTQIDPVAIGLGLAIDRFGRLLRQAIQVGFLALDGLTRLALGPGGEADAGRGVQKFARNPGLMAQPLAQIAVDLADRDAGLGNLQLDVVAPVVGEGRGRTLGIGLGLQGRQLVQQLGGHDLPG